MSSETNKKNSYSQLRAMLALAKASLLAITRNPSAIVFNILFPLIFIIVFGFISGGKFEIDLAVEDGTDMQSPLMNQLKETPSIKIAENMPPEEILSELSKGRIDGVIKVIRNDGKDPQYTAELKTTSASPDRGAVLKMIVSQIIDKQNLASGQSQKIISELREETIQGRRFKMIDFILPGQLGFSLLSAGVFGTAFIFIILRQTLVIKRFFATPVKKLYIILGECISRLSFSMISAVVIILIGTLFFGFTLVNGFVTFINMMLLSVIALVVFLGFGFVVSGIAKNESSVPAIANLITLPQFLLAGTFFPISNFPEWLQPVSWFLPLTYLNQALRKISFEGATIFDVGSDIGILLLWGVVVYAIAAKVFKWE